MSGIRFKIGTVAIAPLFLFSFIFGGLTIQSLSIASAGATTTPGQLLPDQGQYTPVAPTDIFDTGNAIGGAPSLVTPGQTFVIPVEGFTPNSASSPVIPASGVSAVFINIEVFTASGSGSLSDYESDISNPGNSSVSFAGGRSTSGSDVVAVAPDGTTNAGDISITVNGTGNITLAIQVEGYFTSAASTSAGDTFVPTPWTELIDTRNGYGGTQVGAIQPGQDLAVNPVALGIADGAISSAASNVDAVNIEIGTLLPSGSGLLRLVGGANTCVNDHYQTSVVRQMSYVSGLKSRLTDILKVESTNCDPSVQNGQIDIVNAGTVPVQVMINLRGYFVLPSTNDVASSEYNPLNGGPAKICDTRIANTCVNTDGTFRAMAVIPSNSTISIQETGVNGIPASGVTAVSDEIDVLNASSTGWLNEWTGTAAPAYVAPVVNFSGSDSGDNSFDNTQVVTTPSTAGIISIQNVSSGTIDVVVSARGYWLSPTAPSAPDSVTSSLTGTTATVTWDMATDGGSPIDYFTITDVTNGNQTTVSGAVNSGAVQATAATDEITVTATNLIGQGDASYPSYADSLAAGAYPPTFLPSGSASAAEIAQAQSLGLPASVVAQPESGALSIAQGSSGSTSVVRLSNYSSVEALLANASNLTAEQLSFLQTDPDTATLNATAITGSVSNTTTGGSQPHVSGTLRGCGKGSGTWNCVYTLSGECDDPWFLGGQMQTRFSTYEGMSGNYKQLTNVSWPNWSWDWQTGWSPDAPMPTISTNLINHNTDGLMLAAASFTLAKVLVHNDFAYRLDVFPKSNATYNMNFSCENL